MCLENFKKHELTEIREHPRTTEKMIDMKMRTELSKLKLTLEFASKQLQNMK